MFIFMSIIVLLVPLTMYYIGKRWLKHSPEKINHAYGYRTRRSMKSQETWNFAHHYCGKIWVSGGRILLFITIIFILVCALIKLNGDDYAIISGIFTGVQLIIMLITIPLTEAALAKQFSNML